MRRFFRTTYSLAVIVLFVTVALIGFTQTKTFRSYVRSLLIETVASELDGELSLGSLEGNLFTGFRVDSVVLRQEGEPVLTVREVEANYDPLGLLADRLAVSRLVLKNPVITLTRRPDGSWNIARLLKSPSSDSAPSPWVVNFKQIHVSQGVLKVRDSLLSATRAADSTVQVPSRRIDYSDVQIDSLSLDAGLNSRSRELGLTLRSLTGTLVHPHFTIKELSGVFLLTQATLSVRQFNLVTEKSKLQLDARIDSVDVTRFTSLTQLRSVPLSARLNIEKLDFGELKQFAGSPVGFLEGEIACQAELSGQFGAIEVKNLTLQTGTSVVRMAGAMTNLHRPDDLELDLAALRNRVDPFDVERMMPGVGIPDLSMLGVVDFDLQFKGKPSVFHVRFSSSSSLGSLGFDGNIDVRGGSLSYDGKIKTSRFNLAPLVGDSAFTSSLSMKVDLQGRGTRPSEMTSIIRAEVDSSLFAKLPVGRSILVVDIADGLIRPRVALRIGSSRVDVGGTFRVQPRDLVEYDISGRVNSMNLAEVMKRKDLESDVSFDFQAKGELRTLASLAGSIDFNLFRSSVDSVRFEGGPASVRFNTLGAGEQSIQLTCDVVDAKVQGHFTPATLVSALGRGATLVGEAFRHRISTLDSIRAEPSAERVAGFRSAVKPLKDSVDYRVSLHVKDCFPFGVLLGRSIEGSLAAEGHVTEGLRGIAFRGSLTTPDFRYHDETIRFVAQGASVSYDVGGLLPEQLMESMALSLGMKAALLNIEGLQTSNLQIDAAIAGDSVTYRAAALLDSLVTIRAHGSGRNASGLLHFNLRKLDADFNSYVFESVRPVQLRVGRDGLHIANLVMRHEKEEAALSGTFDPTGNSDLSASLYSLQVSSIPTILRRTTPLESLPAVDGIVSAVGSFKGSFDDPQFSVEVNASSVRYEREQFGQVALKTSYAARILNVVGQLQAHTESSSRTPELQLNGTIPYDLTLSKRKEEPLEGEMNLDVHADKFRLEVLDPFISEIDNLRGLMTCNMKLRGTVASPAYEGSMSLENARLLFNPLGIQYVVDGKLVPNGRQIALENVTIRNVSEDRNDGTANFSGSFSLEGLLIKDFDITANGQLLVMKESARRVTQRLYGDLFAGTGPGGVQWRGSPARSFATGRVFVKYSNLTLPPIRDIEDLPISRIDVRFVDDKNQKDSLPEVAPNGRAGGGRNSGGSQRSTRPTVAVQEAPRPQSKSFLDNIVYNLTVESQGITQLKFVFNNFTNEELLADLRGRTSFTKDGDQMRLTGELELGNRSYYNYFKKLDATGKLRFTGDPLNPELDVVASYEGFHRGGLDTASSGILSGSRSFGGGSEKVVVKVYITGVREQPKVRMGLERYDPLGNLIREERKDVEGDAMAFLVTGTFRDELTQQDRLSLAGSTVLGGMASSILSGPLTDLLRKEFGIVRSIDVLYYGGSFQESADVRLTGELGEAVFRLGGRVLSDLNNTNVSLQLPMSALVGSEKWRNLVLEAQRTVQGVETIDQRRESKGVRLLYRIIF